MFAKVLVPTDFSEWSDASLELLPSLREAGTQQALLVHVLDTRQLFAWSEFAVTGTERLEEYAEQALMDRQARLAPLGIEVKTCVIEGAPVEQIVRLAQSEGADLVLMGSRRRSFFRQVVLGSVSENVVRHATVPVLLSKWAGPGVAAAGGLFDHVLFPTDFSPCAEKALALVDALACGGMRRATLIHVQDVRYAGRDGVSPRRVEGVSIERLEDVADTDRLLAAQEVLTRLGVETRVLVREGFPSREILRAAEEEGVTAIVIGSHGKSSLDEMLLGSVSAEVTRQARVPVLVLRRPLREDDA